MPDKQRTVYDLSKDEAKKISLVNEDWGETAGKYHFLNEAGETVSPYTGENTRYAREGYDMYPTTAREVGKLLNLKVVKISQ